MTHPSHRLVWVGEACCGSSTSHSHQRGAAGALRVEHVRLHVVLQRLQIRCEVLLLQVDPKIPAPAGIHPSGRRLFETRVRIWTTHGGCSCIMQRCLAPPFDEAVGCLAPDSPRLSTRLCRSCWELPLAVATVAFLFFCLLRRTWGSEPHVPLPACVVRSGCVSTRPLSTKFAPLDVPPAFNPIHRGMRHVRLMDPWER